MNTFPLPKSGVGTTQRSAEVVTICKEIVAQTVREAMASGWLEEEVALHLADAADDYVLTLARQKSGKIN
jgi:hypothetical protein